MTHATDVCFEGNQLKHRDLVLLAVAGVCLAIAAAIVANQAGRGAGGGRGEGIQFICRECNEAFTVSRWEFFRFRDNNPETLTYPCPNCEKSETTVRAVVCPLCNEPIERSAVVGVPNPVCPKCNRPIE